MSRDFEDTLRDLLVDAADSQSDAYLEPDPFAVLTSGRRVVRRRRMAMVGGTAAAAAVLGLGTWAALDGSTPRAEQVPASRSGQPTTTGIAPDVVSSTLVVEGDPRVTSYTVRLDRSTGRVTAASMSPSGQAGQDLAVGTIPVGEPRAVWKVVSRDPSVVVVGVLPSDAERLMSRFTGGDLGGVTNRGASLPTTSYQAFLFESENPAPDADLAGLDWSAGGRVFTADGSELPSAGFGGGRVLYVDSAGGEMGLVTPQGSAQAPLADAAAGAPAGHLTTAVKDPARPMVTTFAIVLPIDAVDVAVQVDPGTTLVSTDQRPLVGGSGVAVLATVEGPDDATPAVTGLTWTANGRQVTWPNPDR